MDIIGIVQGLIETNAARFIAYGGTAALAGVVWLGKYFNVELSPEITTGVQAAGVLVVTELIRHFVWSQRSVDKITEPGHEPPPAA